MTAYSYSRNPEAAETARIRKEEMDKVAAAAAEATKVAAAAKQQADKAATDSANAVQSRSAEEYSGEEKSKPTPWLLSRRQKPL